MGYLDEIDEWGMHPLGGPYLGLQEMYLDQINHRLGVLNVPKCEIPEMLRKIKKAQVNTSSEWAHRPK